MPGTALDTSVIVDVLLDDPQHAAASAAAIEHAARYGEVAISPITFAQLLTFFVRRLGEKKALPRLREFLETAGIRVAAWDERAAVTAGIAYAHHLAERSTEAVECPHCGTRTRHECPSCGGIVAWRNHMPTDFLIAAHALHASGCLLTRDPHLASKVPGLRVIKPGK